VSIANFHLRARRCGQREPQRGYILLTLMLFVAMLVIAGAAIAPTLTFQIRRDREQELIDRGVEYSRAIRHYYKKFGRYPTSLEALENTNNIHFLRKRYKDPITGKDFKLVHYGEFQMTMGGAALAATQIAAAAATAGKGGQPLAMQGLTPGLTATVSQTPDTNSPEESTPSAPGDVSASANSSSDSSSSDQLTSRVFGGPIIGVASTSKAVSIRVFDHKDHYNEWMFVYDPALDRGGLITTPWQPGLQTMVPNINATTGNKSGTGPGFNTPATSGAFGTSSTPTATPAPAPSQPQN
jgi:hypothetical protein